MAWTLDSGDRRAAGRGRDLTTSPLGAADAPAALALIHLAFSKQSVRTDPPSAALRESTDTVASAITEGGGACFVERGEMVGVVLWTEKADGLYFGRLAVRPDCRRRGIARALIAAAEAEAVRRGLRRVHLSTRLVLSDNRQLFASCGYAEGTLGTHDGYAAPTSIEMEKAL
jgi:ribosomal protein S18 acetylase RimI-like enzyme